MPSSHIWHTPIRKVNEVPHVNHFIYDAYIYSLVKWKLAAEDVVGLYRVGRMG